MFERFSILLLLRYVLSSLMYVLLRLQRYVSECDVIYYFIMLKHAVYHLVKYVFEL